jgi:hypothetical protein
MCSSFFPAYMYFSFVRYNQKKGDWKNNFAILYLHSQMQILFYVVKFKLDS